RTSGEWCGCERAWKPPGKRNEPADGRTCETDGVQWRVALQGCAIQISATVIETGPGWVSGSCSGARAIEPCTRMSGFQVPSCASGCNGTQPLPARVIRGVKERCQ